MGGQEVDIGRRKGEPRAAGTGRYKEEKVNILSFLSFTVMIRFSNGTMASSILFSITFLVVKSFIMCMPFP